MSDNDKVIMVGEPRPVSAQALAYRPERVFIASDPERVISDWPEWTIKIGDPIMIVHPSLLEQDYAHRGRRYIGRKIRQQRRLMRRLFGPAKGKR